MRFLLLLLLLAAGAYAAMALFLFLLQDHLVFPGRTSRGARPASLPPGAQEVHLSTARGIPLYGVFLPSRASPEHSGALLFFGGNEEHLAGALWALEQLRSTGLHVFSVDYPGYGGSGGSPSASSILEAAEAAWEHLLSRPEVDPSRVYPAGRSLGSGPACHLAARHGAAGLVLFSPFTRLVDVAAHHYPWLPVRALLRHRFDNLQAVGRFRAPVFIAHGRGDGIIPSSMGEELAGAASGPVTLLLVEETGHNDLSLHPEGEVGRRLAEFLGS